jgi:hypothetical protein
MQIDNKAARAGRLLQLNQLMTPCFVRLYGAAANQQLPGQQIAYSSNAMRTQSGLPA